MAIVTPADLPVVLKLPSDPIKKYVLTKLGYPTVEVEITEDQFETILKTAGDWIASYFPKESRLAVFYTQPLQPTYPMPADAYWINEVSFDPVTTRLDDIFGAETNLASQLIDLENKTVRLGDIDVGDFVPSFDLYGTRIDSKVIAKKFVVKQLYKVIASKRQIITSADHLYLTLNGWQPLKWLNSGDLVFMSDECGSPQLAPIRYIKPYKTELAVDFQIDKTYNFICQGFVIHNSFLFCFPGGTQLLTTHGPMLCEALYEKLDKTKLITPFGPRKPRMRWNDRKQPIQVIKTDNDFLMCSPNHPVNINLKFRMAIDGYPGLHLLTDKDKQPEIIDRDRLYTDGTWSIQTSNGCFYASAEGKEFYLVH